nr:immunoglobulin light chain junction region [Macaca mulatta]
CVQGLEFPMYTF